MSTYGLGLHTTSSELGLAVSNFAGETRCQVWDIGKDLSTYCHHYLEAFIQPQNWKDFKFIAAAKGPGGFTSTRIGLVTARTLAQQLNVPLFAISTLAAIAWSHRSSFHAGDDLAIELPARRGEIFVAIYSLIGDLANPVGQLPGSTHSSYPLATALPDQVMSVSDWQKTLETWKQPLKLLKNEEHLGTSVLSLLELAYLGWNLDQRPHWSAAIPFYGQHPV